MSITPLETRYAGCRFRSRLEARWAVFFDHLGIKWEYEPQGYTVGPSKRPYLPDFRLPELQAFVEVKGEADRLDTKLLAEFTREQPERGYMFTLVLGSVPAMRLGKIPTHTVFMPVFDFRDYVGDDEPSHFSLVNRAFVALEKLGQEDQKAVQALMSRENRIRVVCHRAFFIKGRGGWMINPFGMANTIGTSEEILNPHTIWPVLPQPSLQRGYEAARSARFEHGEQG